MRFVKILALSLSLSFMATQAHSSVDNRKLIYGGILAVGSIVSLVVAFRIAEVPGPSSDCSGRIPLCCKLGYSQTNGTASGDCQSLPVGACPSGSLVLCLDSVKQVLNLQTFNFPKETVGQKFGETCFEWASGSLGIAAAYNIFRAFCTTSTLLGL